MAGDTVITIVGNATSDPELRFTPGGAAVAKFTVASTPRAFDRQTNEWKDGPTLFLPVTVWRQQAENVAGSVVKGMRVVVQGRLSQRSYEDREGVKRTVFELEADEVAPSLRSATAAVTKVAGGQGQSAYQAARREQGAASAEDPWSSSTPGAQGGAQGAGGGSWGGGGDDEPPF
ncbi:single-stranded DNA-binding protein [Streptomyces sp. NBC_01353]|uniref:single-stranded DNA-binding protein n=1 Tax=Streptomyces sp. NBC_01353 TaxID=2903835 RepID=UPI002E321B80|nr:single-stranded DNA-binding protein [Streptomyces sp. NBC_01353]